MGFLRSTTRPQGDRPIIHEQKNYGDGLVVDIPKTDINTNAVTDLENYIGFERYLEGRSGSLFILDFDGESSATGEVYSIEEHPTSNIVLMHKGTKLWNVYFDITTTPTEILSLGSAASFGLDEDSTIKPFGDDFLVYTASGLFVVKLESGIAPRFFQINGALPQDIEGSGGVGDEEPYKYKYVYTFSTLTDDATGIKAGTGTNRLSSGTTIVHETPPTNPNESPDDESYFALNSYDTAVDVIQFRNLELGSADQAGVPDYITHVTFYRTPDLGQNNLNNLAFEQFAWVEDFWLDKANLGTQTYTDELSDAIINARLISGPRLNSVGKTALPSGDVGEVTEGFIFSALRNTKTIPYSQRVPDDTHVGFYNAGTQFFEVDDGVQVLAKTPDVLSIICNRKTYISALTSVVNSGVFETIFTLTHITVVDDTIGVTDPYSFVKVEQGTYISICSDKSVRVWDGAGWGRDLAENRIRTIIQDIRVGFTVGAYFRGAYLIWYTTNQSDTTPNECLRLSVKRESGKGWTRYTGTDLVIPNGKAGPFVTGDFLQSVNNGFNFLYVLDKDGKIYWIETYKASENLLIGKDSNQAVAYYADKVENVGNTNGTNILPAVQTREVTGARESFNLILQEAHTYLRDLLGDSEPITYPTLLSDGLAFRNGSTTEVESVGKIETGGDIQWWYRVEGDR
ncbi:MAG: hypothetical protein ACTSW1_05455, partial [Candidatus Hodarchaeales archaeon]